jgi:hypothetical protein
MSLVKNIWKDDKGFIWMLVISLLILFSTQLTDGIFGQSKFIMRVGFFLFTVIAIRGSTLSTTGKLIGYVMGAGTLLLAVVMLGSETSTLNLLYTILVTGCMIYSIILVITQIFASRAITAYQIGGGVAAYILLGHIWATFYLAVYIVHPASFQYGGAVITSDEALKHLSYFSFVTLTTIGYGDVIALSPVARMLVMIEGLMGQLFPAIFIAKLVSYQIADSGKKVD